MKNHQCFLLVASVLFTTSCEKTVSLTELTESDFYGVWERHYENYSEGIDSAHVSVDSIMSLLNNGYELYFNDVNGLDIITYVNNDPSRQKVEDLISNFFADNNGLYDRDTAIDVVSFQMENGKNIIRSLNLS